MDAFEQSLRVYERTAAICGNRRQQKRALDAIRDAFRLLSEEDAAANAHRANLFEVVANATGDLTV